MDKTFSELHPPKLRTLASYYLNDLRWQWLAVVCWAFLLIVLSLLPAGKLPEIDLWSELIGTDKLAHALVYGVFTVLLYLPLRSWRTFGGLAAVLFAAAYGASMEWLQFVSRTGRTYDTADMLANSFGALVGYFTVRFFVKSKRNEF